MFTIHENLVYILADIIAPDFAFLPLMCVAAWRAAGSVEALCLLCGASL